MRCIPGLFILMLLLAAACNVNSSGTSTDAGDVPTADSTDTVSDTSPLVSEFTPATGAADDGPGLLGPWNKRVRIAVSDNGLDWTPLDVTVADQADVPTVVTVDGEVCLFFVIWRDKDRTIYNDTVVARSSNLTDWTYHLIDVGGLPNGYTSTPVDPSVVPYTDGFRMYYTLGPVGGGQGTEPHTFSAISTDLVNWTHEGSRFEVNGTPVLDPNALWVEDHYEYFAGGIPGVNHHATSSDGLSFTAEPDFEVDIEGLSLIMANGMDFGDGLYRYYGFSQGPAQLGETAIYSMTWNEDDQWVLEDGVRLSLDQGGSQDAQFVADPAVTVHPEGPESGYVMAYVTAIP